MGSEEIKVGKRFTVMVIEFGYSVVICSKKDLTVAFFLLYL